MKNVLAFVLGATIGSLVTWKLVDEKYKKLAQKEVEEVREYYKGKKEEPVTLKVNQDYSFKGVTDEDIKDDRYVNRDQYSKVLTGLGYDEKDVEELSSDPDISIEKNEDGEYEVFVEPPSKVAPYVISPDEFGEEPGYDAENWTLYDDGILTDDNDQIIGEDEIGIFIGDALDHFGDYENDSVHVRNEEHKCDIEILKHSETYDAVHGGEDYVDNVR